MITIIKGISGSGKSTRLFLFIDFLKSINYTFTPFNYLNLSGKTVTIGYLCHEINTVILGKIYEDKGVSRFQGYDSVTSCFSKSEYLSEFLKENSGKYSFIIEGAGVTSTNRLRPKFLHEFCGFDEIMIQYYNYSTDEKLIYENRITYRSGSPPKGTAMWEKCSGFISDHEKSQKENEDLGSNFFVFYDKYDAHVSNLGVKLLFFYNKEHLLEKFLGFCENSKYIKQNSYEFRQGNI